MICNDRGDARHEWTLVPNTAFVIKEGFEVHSALYGDGKSRYTDVTKVVQEWTETALWPENWEEILYAERKPRGLIAPFRKLKDSDMVRVTSESGGMELHVHPGKLKIHAAAYGVEEDAIDVTERVRQLATSGSLDMVVNNATLTPGQNPFRGRKKSLTLTYSFDDGEHVVVTRAEKDWLIIGPVTQRLGDDKREWLTVGDTPRGVAEAAEFVAKRDGREGDARPVRHNPLEDLSGHGHDMVRMLVDPPRTAAALNDYLVRKFQISDRRLRGPMPIELRDFHRNDLAQLFAELGFKRGAEIGVAEGHYSEILLKANPDLELLLVDPWRRYDGNPYAHSQEHQDFSLNETRRKTAPYPNVRIMQDFSMNAVREVEENSLDFTYVDAHHGFDWVMQDLIEWGKRVRSGGIISGDDYYHFKRHWAGVIEAVNAYTQAHRVSPWFLIDAPRSVDFFWCKP